MKLSRQHEQLLEIHRDMKFHCSTEYEYMRDHRKRISELNLGYLKEKGYYLKAVKCDGRCGKNHNSMVAMRRAERVTPLATQPQPTQPQKATGAPLSTLSLCV
jgi:hypothetical protein